MTDWLARLMEALDEAHGDHNEGCDCYDRLADAVREGIYRFPDVSYGPRLPPVFGCETPMDAAVRRISERIAEDLFRSTAVLQACESRQLVPERPAAKPE